ncbi:hypothetical protein [Rhizobium sp. LjRoot254]|uniref:hypothetical protein n=1 Tax=Rhizobium sp. LjRoot254 TaxID=3342297 RepID=UPI003ECF3E8B
MNFEQRPTPSTAIVERDGGWVVVTQNMDGKDRQERFFHGRAEANAFWLKELARTKAAN